MNPLRAIAPANALGIIALLAWLALAFALFSQHGLGMAPCAWCILQRMIMGLIAMSATVAWLLRSRSAAAVPLGAMAAVLLALGGAVAAWYQHTVAANAFSCDLSFADRVVAGSGLDQALPAVFGIYATCADSAVNLFGVRYEIWTLILFLVIALLGVRALTPRAPASSRG